MTLASWAVVAGVILVVMALSSTLLSRLPLSSSMLYLAVGIALSPLCLGWARVEPVAHARQLGWLVEVVVLVSLFGSGMKMSAGLGDGRWVPPLRLATVSMLITVALVAAVGCLVLGLPLGAAILLGGILAPTDPVLASEVQLAHAKDRDRLRFALTGEAGLNDGTAFPVVLLGMGLLGLQDLGTSPWRWIAVEVLWAVGAGIVVGAALGTATARVVIYLRRTHKEALGLDSFLALGLMGLAFGVADLVHAYGFLAVFAAGVALRREEQRASGEVRRATEDAEATDSERAPAAMAHAVLDFNEQLERIGEVAAVVVVGMLLWTIDMRLLSWLMVTALLLAIRPVAVLVGLAGSRTTGKQRALVAWFGIRGIGSLFYLMHALDHGLAAPLAGQITAIVLSVVVVSIVVHGVSVTPLMALYERRKTGRASASR